MPPHDITRAAPSVWHKRVKKKAASQKQDPKVIYHLSVTLKISRDADTFLFWIQSLTGQQQQKNQAPSRESQNGSFRHAPNEQYEQERRVSHQPSWENRSGARVRLYV
jgi:hypothetical protein